MRSFRIVEARRSAQAPMIRKSHGPAPCQEPVLPEADATAQFSRMSIKNAAAFITRLRLDPAISARMAALGDDPSLERVAGIASAAGLDCSAEDLRLAFRHDWVMRSFVVPKG